ncbi:TasA family protein [Rossellomorea marisflavi]|jgi:spore coat-associated protein N|uniref:TasA family protein n=1 Tax=Rossellomorea marisflavi TaxID=189381 RepID=UPI002852FB21|nr:TasA family protein [Rossellomorea marisflavi]MDR4935382.1 TasA family protein [Rossellomorea marisflavi]
MTIKKKLGLGVASAALGLSLIGGGTFAAFNDTATINNHFASGTLDLEVGSNAKKPINFDLSNMKPGDSVQRIFNLNNAGSLAIKEVLLNTTANAFEGNEGSTQEGFLSQFQINFMKVDTESNRFEPRGSIIKSGQKLTLADLVNGKISDKIDSKYLAKDGSGRINLAPLVTEDSARNGIPVEPKDTDAVFIEIEFVKNDERVAGPYSDYKQNIYMNNKVDFFFNLEATQWDGMHVDSHNKNGSINNGVQGSANGSSQPDPVTKGEPKYKGNEVKD